VRVTRLEDLAALETLIERLTLLESGAATGRKPDGGTGKKKLRGTEGDAAQALGTPHPDESAAGSLPEEVAVAVSGNPPTVPAPGPAPPGGGRTRTEPADG